MNQDTFKEEGSSGAFADGEIAPRRGLSIDRSAGGPKGIRRRMRLWVTRMREKKE